MPTASPTLSQWLSGMASLLSPRMRWTPATSPSNWRVVTFHCFVGIGRHVTLDRRVEIEPPAVVQTRNRHRRQRFREGAEAEARERRDRRAASRCRPSRTLRPRRSRHPPRRPPKAQAGCWRQRARARVVWMLRPAPRTHWLVQEPPWRAPPRRSRTRAPWAGPRRFHRRRPPSPRRSPRQAPPLHARSSISRCASSPRPGRLLLAHADGVSPGCRSDVFSPT